MAATTVTDLLLETMALAADQDQSSRLVGDRPAASDHCRCEFERTVLHVANQGDADGDVQPVAQGTRLGLNQGTMVPFSLPCFNRLVRTRMLGGVGSAGEIPALTRLTVLHT